MREQEIIKDIETAVNYIIRGGVILYPTDTIWGIGCDATTDSAIKRVFSIKERPESKAMISLVGSVGQLKEFVNNIPDIAIREIENSSSPVTIIFDSPKGISPFLIAEDGSAAFRIPQDDFTRELCLRAGKPLVSTSANIAGMPPATTFSEINDALINKVDYVCEFGRERKGSTPSRILKIDNEGKITIIRP